LRHTPRISSKETQPDSFFKPTLFYGSLSTPISEEYLGLVPLSAAEFGLQMGSMAHWPIVGIT